MSKYLGEGIEENGSKLWVFLVGVEKVEDLVYFFYLVVRRIILFFKNNGFIDI